MGSSSISPKKPPKGYFTQWASQFCVAAELTRRGYLVTLPLGNAPKTDIMAISPSGKRFTVEVKGLGEGNWWIIGKVEPSEDLFYILVHVPREDPTQRPRFFIMKSDEVKNEEDKYIEEKKAKGKKVTEMDYGFAWKTVFKYENQWDKLPK